MMFWVLVWGLCLGLLWWSCLSLGLCRMNMGFGLMSCLNLRCFFFWNTSSFLFLRLFICLFLSMQAITIIIIIIELGY